VDRLDWQHSTLLHGDVFEEVAKLKRQPGKELRIYGSGTLIQTVMQRELIDEYRLFIHPVVLGNGTASSVREPRRRPSRSSTPRPPGVASLSTSTNPRASRSTARPGCAWRARSSKAWP